MSEFVTCVECGKVEELRWVESRNDDLKRRQMCFTDAFWAEHREEDDEYAIVTDDFTHYQIGDEDYPIKRGPGRGFDGTKFRVQFYDGREVWTTNLWGQGTVPEHWRGRFTPNAEVVSEWTLKQAGRLKGDQ
jgi:hypothetical protein